MWNIIKNIAIYIHQLAFRFNCLAATIHLSPPLLYAADNFHVNFNVNKNTDVSFNTLPRLRANCVSSRGCQRDYLCVSASGGLSRAYPRKDFNKLIYIPRRQPFCKLHSARHGDREDWPTPGRTTPMNCCHFNEPVLIICDAIRSCSYWKPTFQRISRKSFTRNLHEESFKGKIIWLCQSRWQHEYHVIDVDVISGQID